MKRKHILFASTFLFILVVSCLSASPKPVYVFLWFDTEDYILPASDDALLRLAKFLENEKIPSTFKIVGEKARVLEERGRVDIIEALKYHEVGYHTNFHSVQPTPAMYLSELGWFEGVAEFDRRESEGFHDVKRITGQNPSCYGQPGSSWGPQQYGGLRNWGVDVYLDAGEHISLDGQAFWYCGVLNLYELKHTLRTELGGDADLQQAKNEFESAYRDLQANGGGVVSIYYHPCEFAHREFWDGVNFSKGANPPRDKWKVPPQKTPEEMEVAHQTFESWMKFIKSHPGVRFVTASQGLKIFPDPARTHQFTVKQIQELADRTKKNGLDYLDGKSGLTVSPGELLYLYTKLVAESLSGNPKETIGLPVSPILGPVTVPPDQEETISTRQQLAQTVQDVLSHLEKESRVPDVVWLGSELISPESFMMTLAELISEKEIPESVTFYPAELKSARYVRNDKRLWGWVIFPADFEAPRMMELARRQAWTLKPAILTDSVLLDNPD